MENSQVSNLPVRYSRSLLYSNKVRPCADCEEVFTVQKPLDFVCYDCEPYCIGCNEKFSPINRSTRLCNTCIKKKDDGVCTICNTLIYPARHSTLNEAGHCEDCIDLESKYAHIDTYKVRKCTVCKKNEVQGPTTNMCIECLTKKDICPHCSEDEKYISDYCCNKCKLKYMNQEKTYKLPQ